MLFAITILSTSVSMMLAAFIVIANEIRKEDQRIIASKNAAISELLDVINMHGIELDDPYSEFLAYIDEEAEQ